MSFSDNLYRLRAERNMTQEQLAMLMGVSRQAISKWESARAVAELPATRALVQANPEVPRLAKVWVKRQTAIAAATALAGFGLLAGVFALLGWPIWFIPLAVGITAAVLIWVYMPVAQ